MERLQKILARAGLASRREAERWIEEGRVTVNGRVVKEQGSKADPLWDRIKVDGKPLALPAAQHLYYLFNKPAGMLTAMRDAEGRPHLGQWLGPVGKRRRLFPVGRLDFNTSGVLLLTNDGELAYRLSHPRYEVKKLYHVKLNARPSESRLESLRKGIRLADGRAAVDAVRVFKVLRKKAWLEVEIHEGRYREVRRMFEALGYFVEKLARVSFGPIRLGALPPGELRPLMPYEVAALRRAAGVFKNEGGRRKDEVKSQKDEGK